MALGPISHGSCQPDASGILSPVSRWACDGDRPVGTQAGLHRRYAHSRLVSGPLWPLKTVRFVDSSCRGWMLEEQLLAWLHGGSEVV
jgi:hypothetical protein